MYGNNGLHVSRAFLFMDYNGVSWTLRNMVKLIIVNSFLPSTISKSLIITTAGSFWEKACAVRILSMQKNVVTSKLDLNDSRSLCVAKLNIIKLFLSSFLNLFQLIYKFNLETIFCIFDPYQKSYHLYHVPFLVYKRPVKKNVGSKTKTKSKSC